MTLQDYEMLLKTMEMLKVNSLLDTEMFLRKLAMVSRGNGEMQVSSHIRVVGMSNAEESFPVEKYVYDEFIDVSNIAGLKCDLAIATNAGISQIKKILKNVDYLLTNRKGMAEVPSKYYEKGMTLSLGDKEYILFDLR